MEKREGTTAPGPEKRETPSYKTGFGRVPCPGKGRSPPFHLGVTSEGHALPVFLHELFFTLKELLPFQSLC